MPDLSFHGLAARAAAVARALSQQVGTDPFKLGSQSTAESSVASFGDILIQRQQSLGGPLSAALTGPLDTLPWPQLGGQTTLTSRLAPPTTPLSLPSRETTPAISLPPSAVTGQTEAAAAQSTGPAIKVGTFGHWEQKPEPRPFFWLREDQLDASQSRVVEKWKASPYRNEWSYDVQPAPENNWAGWGPPPASWVMRDASGKPSQALPWPPPGEPPADWG